MSLIKSYYKIKYSENSARVIVTTTSKYYIGSLAQTLALYDEAKKDFPALETSQVFPNEDLTGIEFETAHSAVPCIYRDITFIHYLLHT